MVSLVLVHSQPVKVFRLPRPWFGPPVRLLPARPPAETERVRPFRRRPGNGG
ncbi:MAG: hypothetical protein KatS3mg061_2373 [Dehalococcoidia bacterium]|nr:MAG: hypothetical protein KatS3mg061_2373 [Dehalococcoidia bacterium]